MNQQETTEGQPPFGTLKKAPTVTHRPKLVIPSTPLKANVLQPKKQILKQPVSSAHKTEIPTNNQAPQNTKQEQTTHQKVEETVLKPQAAA